MRLLSVFYQRDFLPSKDADHWLNWLQQRFLEQLSVDCVGGPFFQVGFDLGELLGECPNQLIDGSDIRIFELGFAVGIAR